MIPTANSIMTFSITIDYINVAISIMILSIIAVL